MWLLFMLCFPKFLCNKWLALYYLCVPRVTQGLIAKHFPGTECITLMGKENLRNPRLAPCIAIKTRTRIGYTWLWWFYWFWFEMKLRTSGVFAVHVLFPEPACSCGMLGYGWYAEPQLRGSQILCLSWDHTLSVFNKSHSFPPPVLSPQYFLISAVISYLCMQLSGNNFTLPLCSTWYLFTKCLLSYYLCKLGNVGFGIPVSQSEN